MARALAEFLGRKGGRARTIAVCGALLAALLALVLGNLPALAEMGAYLQYKFIQRALIVGALVALCAALLGVVLVLKRIR